jgi:hypothetical protein
MNRWLQIGVGVVAGYLTWKYFLRERTIVEPLALSGPIAANAYRRAKPKTRKPWRKRTAMRVGERARMAKRAPGCFLKPSERKYPICAKGSSRPSCEGLLAARRRAILNRDTTVRGKAERKALSMGCGWALRSKKLAV